MKKNSLKEIFTKDNKYESFILLVLSIIGLILGLLLTLNILKLDEKKSCLDLTDDEINTMVKLIKNLPFAVKGYYDNNQIYSGGVHLSCLDKNLQSKQIPNLFFCGEICDVDGICGGFNLQWAWTSGYIVGTKLNEY